MSKVRTRFAPSPTGGLHLGGIRTALFNYLFTKKNGGDFILRIEDTDRKRFVADAEDYIRKSLDWLGLTPDESPWNPNPKYGKYRQSERDYRKYVDQLIDSGMAYYAFDTSEDLDKMRNDLKDKGSKDLSYNRDTRMMMKNSFTLSDDEVKSLIDSGTPYVVRFNTPVDMIIKATDMIRGDVKFNSNVMDDKVLLKADGIPTYHMANIVDDHLMEITHVIRGEEWLPSLPLHIMLYDALGWTPPTFAHLPLILNPNGKGKLSKRTAIKEGFSVFPLTWTDKDDKGNKVTMTGYKEDGYEADAFLNFLALLGWTPNDDKEILSISEMIDDFDMNRIAKAGCRFDITKCNWINSQYVNNLSTKDVVNSKKFTSDKLDMIASLAKERAVFRKDFKNVIDIFDKNIDGYTNLTQLNDEFKLVFTNFVDTINSTDIDFTDGQTIKDYIYKLTVKDNGLKFGKVMPGLRQALTGGVSGPDLMTTMVILGKDESINRIKKALV